jgi:hypothetical protein
MTYFLKILNSAQISDEENYLPVKKSNKIWPSPSQTIVISKPNFCQKKNKQKSFPKIHTQEKNTTKKNARPFYFNILRA